MPPLAAIQMGESEGQGFDVDIERQAVGENTVEAKSTVPTFLLTSPNENLKLSNKDIDSALPLPSSQYRYTKWHDIQSMEIRGNMLRSPRIRRAPKGYNASTIHEVHMEGETMNSSSRTKLKERTLNYQRKLECWEICEAVNLSFQHLGDPYQLKQFLTVLQRLIRCENLQLIDNGLKDLSNIYLPRCTHLYLQRNFMSNLKKLPRTPSLTHISLQHNDIRSLDGLGQLNKTKIVSLTLQDNPVELDPNYRQNVFKRLPNLKILDNIPRLQEDTPTVNINKTCTIS